MADPIRRSHRLQPPRFKEAEVAAPLLCPRSHEMRIVALIDDRQVIERILRHLGLWEPGMRVSQSTGPPA